MSDRPARWHYSIDGTARGPVTAAELRHLAATGVLGPNHLVRTDGMRAWVPAARVKGLFAPPGQCPPPPPLPPPTPVRAARPGAVATVVRASPAPDPVGPGRRRDGADARPDRPALWNPNAAANWSLVLTPAFGAYLHAANWRALGRPDRAATNMVFVWVTAGFLGANLLTFLAPAVPYAEFVLESVEPFPQAVGFDAGPEATG